QRLMEVGATLGHPVVPGALSLPQDVGEQVAECRRRGATDADREVEAFEPERLIDLRPIQPAGVVPATSIGIAQRLVRLGNLPELRRGGTIPGIDVRVIPPREPLVRTLNVVQRGAALNSQQDVEVHEISGSQDLRISGFGLMNSNPKILRSSDPQISPTAFPRPPPPRR